MIKKFDQKIFLMIYNHTQRHPLLRQLGVFIAKYSSSFFSVLYFSFGIWLFYNKNPKIRSFILIPAVVYLLVKIIPYFYNRRRPFVELGCRNRIKQRKDHSFPSTHAASALIISLVIFNISPESGIIVIFMAILTAFSRIMVGVHYPTDIAAAWLIALIIYFLASFFS